MLFGSEINALLLLPLQENSGLCIAGLLYGPVAFSLLVLLPGKNALVTVEPGF